MSAPKKYSEELRGRATRMAVELRRDPDTRSGAITRVSQQLRMHPETLRIWVKRAEVDAGDRPGTTTADDERIVALLALANRGKSGAAEDLADVEAPLPASRV